MKPWLATLSISLLGVLASCSHPRQVAHVEGSTRNQETPGEREVPPDRSHPPVPAAPSALLQPGGAEQVKGALTDRGLLQRPSPGDTLDDATAAALRRFQRSEGLAATGFPDRETLRRLGLEPAKIYRTSDSDTERGGRSQRSEE